MGAPLMLGVSGLRGIVGESLTDEVAARWSRALAVWLRERNPGAHIRVAVGRDGRQGGERFEQCVTEALIASGCDVLTCGVLSTPTMGVTVAHGSFDAGVVVTASHNPQQWNGLKAIVGNGSTASAPDGESAGRLVALFHESARPDGDTDGSLIEDDLAPTRTHVELVLRALERVGPVGDAHAVVDSVNCSGAVGADLLTKALDVRMTQVYGDGSGIFPHTPEPTAENLSGQGGLCDAIRGLKADVGFAQDPDADRLAIVDEHGKYIGEEYTLAIAAEALLGALGDGAKGKVVCANLSTSRMIDDIASKYGAGVVRTAVGEANVVQAMLEHDAVLGGEGNGGVIWPGVVHVRDSLGSMALTLALMARTGRSVSQIVSDIDATCGGAYAIEKRKTEIPSKEAAGPAVDAIARAYSDQKLDQQDGVRVDWDDAPHGGGPAWLHVRASNTEPIMRLICEAHSEGQAVAILEEAAGVIGG